MSSSMMKDDRGVVVEEEEGIKRYLKSFPPGWRFSPTEPELIDTYLKRKLENTSLPIHRMKDVNLYNHNPWELTENFTSYGENEFYFFTPRDRKYRNGSRPKRAAGIGFWKATGRDRAIFDSHGVEIGSRKLLVFYIGKAPKGEKTPWAMHEYKLKDENAEGTTNIARTAATTSATGGDMQLDEWVLCKIYKKAKQEPATAPAAAATATATPAAATATATPAAAAASENTATKEENTAGNMYACGDISYDQELNMEDSFVIPESLDEWDWRSPSIL